MSTPLISTLQTPICTLLGCDVPVVLAGMGGVARSELVAAVSAAGGFGFLGMVREPPDLIRSEIARVRAVTSREFGVNLIPAATRVIFSRPNWKPCSRSVRSTLTASTVVFMHEFEGQYVPAADVGVRIKRIYEKPVRRDGYRVLVDRLWPCGIKREVAALDEWLRDIAPSTELREWFAHEPQRWSAFRDRYLEELCSHATLLDALRDRATRQRVTLLYAARTRK